MIKDIPPEDRVVPPTLQYSRPKDVEELTAAILAHVDSIELGMCPLGDLSKRFNVVATRLGVTVREVLANLARDGKLAFRVFQDMNASFVFNRSYWEDLKATKGGLGDALRNVEKAKIEERTLRRKQLREAKVLETKPFGW